MKNAYLLNQIARKLCDGELVFFIGAGLSKSIDSDYPTGEELKKSLLNELSNHEEQLNHSLLEVAEEYEKTYSRVELERFVCKRIQGVSSEISTTCQIISLFPIDIITTNYDDLMENNFKELNALDHYNVVIEDSDISNNKPRRALLKMHGSCSPDDRPRRIILTTSDYADFLKSNPLTVSYLKSLLSKSILFLGYSLNDSDFREIFKSVRDDLGVSAAQCYVQMRSPVTDNDFMPETKGIHYLKENLDGLMKNLFLLVFFGKLDFWAAKETSYNQKGAVSNLGEKEKTLLQFLYEDQFDSGLWGKSIKELFRQCFNNPEVPAEYQNFGSFSATDIVLRDILPSLKVDKLWRRQNIVSSIKMKTDSFGGVGVNEMFEINKFSLGQKRIDSNIRHTCAVLNINLFLGEYEHALLNATWLCQVEKFWLNERDGKLPINVACLIDCFDHAMTNRGFAEFCYNNPKGFNYVKDIFINWKTKKKDLYLSLNKTLSPSKGLWILKDESGNFIDSTQIYITLFILLRLPLYSLLFPKLFCRIVEALYSVRCGYGIPLSPSFGNRLDVGATGSFLKILYDENAQNTIRNEMPEKNNEIIDWADASFGVLLDNSLTYDNLSFSFAEIISPVVSLIRQKRQQIEKEGSSQN